MIVYQWTLFNILGGMEFILGLLKSIKYYFHFWMNIHINMVLNRTCFFISILYHKPNVSILTIIFFRKLLLLLMSFLLMCLHWWVYTQIILLHHTLKSKPPLQNHGFHIPSVFHICCHALWCKCMWIVPRRHCACPQVW